MFILDFFGEYEPGIDDDDDGGGGRGGDEAEGERESWGFVNKGEGGNFCLGLNCCDTKRGVFG